MDPKLSTQQMVAPGPFKASDLKSGDPYELSRGHAIFVAPTGMAGARRQGLGYQVLATDPDAVGVAIDVGISTEPGMLRAPDIALGVGDGPGWDTKAPPLAVEYADRGQDENELQAKIAELLAAGTRLIWVVRLVGPRRVEIHTSGRPVEIIGDDGFLEARGLLRNPVPVAALFDEARANEVALNNLLQRHGHAGLDEMLEEAHQSGQELGHELGRDEAARSALRTVLTARFGAIAPELDTRIAAMPEAQAQAAIALAATVASLADFVIA